MKVLTVDSNQGLKFSELDKPQITEDECLVNVHAIGVNRADILQKQGKYPAPKGESPILGLEVCGKIIECGTKVTGFSIDDLVFGLVAGGGYAEYVKVKTSQLIALPQNLDTVEGASVAEVYLTAYQCLFTIAGLKNSQKVLIHAGASGVGCAAIQLAKAKNCYVVATVGNEDKVKACQKLGADKVINYHNEDYVQWSKSNVPEGYDIIIDVVAGSYVNKNINIAALDAHIVILAILGGRFSEAVDVAKMLMKRITIQATTLRNRSESYKANLVRDFTNDFYGALSTNKIKPVIDAVYSWRNVETAHQRMENNHNIGKIVLKVD